MLNIYYKYTLTQNYAHSRGQLSEHLHGKHFNGDAINDQLAISNVYCATELPMGGVILEQVRLHRIQHLHVREMLRSVLVMLRSVLVM